MVQETIKNYDSLTVRRGLSSEDWKVLQSKIKRANLEQLYYLQQCIDQEIVVRNGQNY